MYIFALAKPLKRKFQWRDLIRYLLFCVYSTTFSSQALAHDVYSDLVEDACLGLCFEVHRAVKQGYFFLDETDQESMKDFGEYAPTAVLSLKGGFQIYNTCLSDLEIVDQPGVDIFGQVYNQWKNKECVCPNCNRSIAASRFAPHLEKCLGMGRNSSRIANRRSAGMSLLGSLSTKLL